MSAIHDADRIIGLVGRTPRTELIVNRYRPGMVSRMLDREDILEILAIPLVGIVLGHEDIIVSANSMPVAFIDESYVGMAYINVAKRILGECSVPSFEGGDGFGDIYALDGWRRIRKLCNA